VKWKARANGSIPLPSHLSYHFVKKYAPYKVCEFWEDIYNSSYSQVAKMPEADEKAGTI
jgi:hypothetical protein